MDRDAAPVPTDDAYMATLRPMLSGASSLLPSTLCLPFFHASTARTHDEFDSTARTWHTLVLKVEAAVTIDKSGNAC